MLDEDPCRKIVAMHRISPSTALPIMRTSPKSYTCQHCFLCNTVFNSFDVPVYISWITSIDKQNEFLKIKPSLSIDSCLCQFCWESLVKNKDSILNEELFSEKKTRLLECYYGRKKRSKNEKSCSIHFCSENYSHKMSVNEYENIKKILSTFESCSLVFFKSTKETSDLFPFRLCEDHNAMITVMSSCQICSCKLNEPFNTTDWSMYETWNWVLIENNLPLILQSGMFICMTCRGHISKLNPGFPTNNLPHLRKNITINNAIRLKLYGESQHNLFDICQGSTYATPIVVAKIEENKESVCSTKVKFTDPLITATYRYEVDYDEHDTESMTSTVLLNVGEKKLVSPKLEPQDEGLDFVQLEEEHSKTFTTNKPTDQFNNLFTDSTPNTSGIQMTNSLNENVDDIPENILSEQNYASNLLQLHSDHQLKNYDIKISKYEEINQYPGISNDSSLQIRCKVNNVEIVKNKPEIIDSRQVVSEHNEIKNNQSKLNSNNIICTVVPDLKEINQCLNEINTIHKTVNLNETDNSMYSCITAIEPPNVLVNPVSIRRKQKNVICDTISNKIVKKPRPNEKYSSYENNTHKSCGNKNIAHPSINSDLIGVKDLSGGVDEESLKLQSSNLLKDIELNTNVPSIHVETVNSLNPSCASPPQLHLLKKIPYSYNKEKYSRKGVKNVLLDNNVSDSNSLPETITLSEHGSLSDSEIRASNFNILLDSEEFSETDSEFSCLPPCEFENDFVIIKNNNNSDSDGNKILKLTHLLDTLEDSNSKNVPERKIRSGAEAESDNCEESQCIISVSDSEKIINDKKLTTFKVIDIKSDREVLLNDVKVFEPKSHKKGNKMYHCVYKDEIEPSGDEGFSCIIVYDTDEVSNNTNLTTYKVNVIKGLDYTIFLDDERVMIVLEGKNKNKQNKILFNKVVQPSSNEASICIVIIDNEKENCSKKLSTFKTVCSSKRPDNEVLNGKELNIVNLDRWIKYTVTNIDIGSNGNDKKYYCFIKLNNKVINKKNIENYFDNQEIYCKKVSDMITMPKDIIDVDDSHGDNELDKVQEYFKEIFSAIQYFFKTSSNKSQRELYSKIGNDTDMLLYLMENFRMFYNEELVVPETADEFSKNYLKEQKKMLYDCFGDPNDSINASKPFIHPSSHLHQYSKRLSTDVISLPIQDMTSSSSLTKSNSIASKVQTQISKYQMPNLRQIILPVAIKKKKNFW
ncbi:uncharacterized protein LOC111033403 isoform X2 [Myzus persicae]|uniref:uncharacterized protein LOC111033403 isoform X2 n=1 Tax=Myzus persicae TaxID=13164 RepID=UPI000B9304DA|nr:uncharacterized protein LOC111033403 isoform X2 [Myzus persicae]